MPQLIGLDLGGDEWTSYTINGVTYVVRHPYYLASCDGCGWIGSSEECGTDGCWGDDSDVYCPKCHAAGADCGRVAQDIEDAIRNANGSN